MGRGEDVIVPEQLLAFVVTAYSLCCGPTCDAPGPFTASGAHPVAGFTVAADPKVLPIGSIIHIEGLGRRMVHDVGGGVHGNHIDIFVDTCEEARQWGRRHRKVRIIHTPKRRGHREK
jgi:3D (Asp-Asp-Asp) domain-containing protein